MWRDRVRVGRAPPSCLAGGCGCRRAGQVPRNPRWSGHVVSTDEDLARLVNEQLIFEPADYERDDAVVGVDYTAKERITVRVHSVVQAPYGQVVVTGWRLDDRGMPTGPVSLRVSLTTLTARRLHRQPRNF